MFQDKLASEKMYNFVFSQYSQCVKAMRLIKCGCTVSLIGTLLSDSYTYRALERDVTAVGVERILA